MRPRWPRRHAAGAAVILARDRPFDGAFHFIFQPAEEGGAGAQRMIDDGLFERLPVDAVYGIHNWPELPVGTFAVHPGPIMGSSLKFTITVAGKGCHAASPHLGIDPVPILCDIVQAFQTLVARRCSAADSVVISITQLGAGAQGASARVEFDPSYPATVNSEAEEKLCSHVMKRLIGNGNVINNLPVRLTVEDFGFMLVVKPGAYALLGAGKTVGEPGLHHPAYDFNDDVIPPGIRYWLALVQETLKEGA